MDLHTLTSKTPRSRSKRVGRGGKRGTTSGGGTKGQKSRSGASVRPGFRGGDNRIWQLFPKNRGATKKPGNKKPHRKHRFFQLRAGKPAVVKLADLNIFDAGTAVTPELLEDRGLVAAVTHGVKVLSNGELKNKLTFKGLAFSAAAREKIEKAGGKIE